VASPSSGGRRGPLVYAAAVTALTIVGHVSGSLEHHISAIAYVAAYVLTFPLCLLLLPLEWFVYFLLSDGWLLAAALSVMFALAAYVEAVVVRRWIRQRQ